MIDLVAANHTNRELELMLEGRKPLAMFYAELAELPDEELIPEQRFTPYVSKGQFIRGETTVSGSFSEKLGRKTQIRFVFFALREEAWRVAAMKLLKEQHYKTNAWNETCERAECVLLGYTDEETDAWCKKAFPK